MPTTNTLNQTTSATSQPTITMTKKPFRIGIVGYGFMGRTHANAYHNAANFFDASVVPVLQAACGRDEAARAVRNLEGVRGVTNLIRVETLKEATVADVVRRIEQALHRQADLDARAIGVTTNAGVVRLEGTVASLAARRLAQLAAESAPGFTKVVNDLDVS